MLGNLLAVLETAKELSRAESFQKLIRHTLELVGGESWINPDFRKEFYWCACER